MPLEVHGKASRFKLGTVALPSTLVDISGYLTNVTFPQEFDEDETSAFGDQVKEFILGLSDSQITLTGNWDPTIAAQLEALSFSDVAVLYEWYPAGTATGQTKYSGSVQVYGFSTSAGIGGKDTFTTPLQQAGNITRTVL